MSEFVLVEMHIADVLYQSFLSHDPIPDASPVDVVSGNVTFTRLCSGVYAVKYLFRPLRVSVLKEPIIFTINTAYPLNVCNVSHTSIQQIESVKHLYTHIRLYSTTLQTHLVYIIKVFEVLFKQVQV